MRKWILETLSTWSKIIQLVRHGASISGLQMSLLTTSVHWLKLRCKVWAGHVHLAYCVGWWHGWRWKPGKHHHIGVQQRKRGLWRRLSSRGNRGRRKPRETVHVRNTGTTRHELCRWCQSAYCLNLICFSPCNGDTVPFKPSLIYWSQ